MAQRNYGIDLLRCVAMFMVLLLHLLLYSGTLVGYPLFSAGYETAWTIELFAFGAVDIYALISGYVGVGRKVRYAGLANLWLTVCFYTVLATAVFSVLEPANYNLTPDSVFHPFVKAFFPVISNQYWYFCSYFLLFLFLPLLNAGLDALSDLQLRVTAVTLFLACSVADIFSYIDVLRMASGYSPMWLVVLYVLGAAIRRNEPLKKAPKWALLLGYVVFSALTALSKYLIGKITLQTRGQIYRDDYLVRYISPTVVCAAVCLLLLFSRLNLPGWLQRVTAFLAPSAFCVYLIHENPLVREFCMKRYFLFLPKLSAPMLVPALAGCAIGLYLACTAFDLIRRGLFRLLGVKPRLNRAEEKVGVLLRRRLNKETPAASGEADV